MRRLRFLFLASAVFCCYLATGAVTAHAQSPAGDSGKPRDLAHAKPLDERGEADRWAVVIGVSKYRQNDISLAYPASDARAVADALQKYCGFAPDHIKLLVDDQATASQIRSAIGTWLPQVAGRQDTVVIYYSGHGAPDLDSSVAEDGIRKYLVPHDADPENLFGTAVPMDDLSASLLRLRSERTVVLLDCCYSGAAAPAAAAGGERTFARKSQPSVANRIKSGFVDSLALSGRGRAVMTASEPGERSWEYDDLRHGIFTYYLLKGMEGAAADSSGAVTVDGLYRYVYSNLQKKEKGREAQTPILATSVAGILTLTATSANSAAEGVLQLVTSPIGAQVYIDRDTKAYTTPFSRSLSRGTHRITVYKPNYLPITEELVVSPVRPTLRNYVLSVEETKGDILLDAPIGVRVLLDGKQSGTAVAQLTRFPNLDSGQHVLRIEQEGFTAQEIPVLVPRGGATLVKARLSESLAGMRGPTAQETVKGLSSSGGTYRWLKDNSLMVFVSPGAFAMGQDGIENAQPKHNVSVSGFWIDSTEVTNAQFARFVNEANYNVRGKWIAPVSGTEADNLPATNVTMEDAKAYAAWAGKRLPTEAEWEKAARGTDERLYPYGDEMNPLFQNGRSYGVKRALPVGTLAKGVSPYGAFDMLGNVWEWCDSPYNPYPGNAAFDTNVGKNNYVLRGGSYLLPALKSDLSVTLRAFSLPNIGQEDVGFRCVVSAE